MTERTFLDRRHALRVLGIGATGSLAGCSGPSSDADGGSDGSSSSGSDGDSSDGGEEDSDSGSDDGTPGMDMLGGPDDLQSSATVEALVLDEDQGAGRNVFSPAVVWVETGATISWDIASGTHSVTAYHPDMGGPMRIPQGATPFDSETVTEGSTFEHTFDTPGVYNYFCRPHQTLGMVGVVIVSEATPGNGTAPLDNVDSEAEANGLSGQLDLAGVDIEAPDTSYGWLDATTESYWYSLYNMSTNIAMNGNGIVFPATDEQQETFQKRFPEMLSVANQPGPPVKNPNLNMAPFTEGDPSFTQEPVLSGDDGRPDASTLQWDGSASSMTVSPSSIAWTHLKGVTWAKNFQTHFDILPDDLAAEFRSMVLSTLAQVGTVFALVSEQGGWNLRLNDENLLVASAFRPGEGITDETPRPRHHSAMLWFLSGLNSLAQNGWYGYVNPEPLIPPENVQMLTNGMGKTTMNAVSPSDLSNPRLIGELLGGVGWFGTQTNTDQLRTNAVEYADGLAARIESNLDGNGRVGGGPGNQAAIQGAVGQGLLWASQIDGVDHTDTAGDVLGYLSDTLFDEDAGIFVADTDADTHQFTARDVGDITGGVNAADAVLGNSEVRSQYATFFNQTVNRGGLQRAERPPSRNENAEFPRPLPPKAGGEFGQAAVYNAAVEYDAGGDEWSAVDDTFDTEASLYLANQEVWISNWGGDFYPGRGVPGQSESPP